MLTEEQIDIFGETFTEIFQKLETARAHAQQGQVREAETFVADVRAKYGL